MSSNGNDGLTSSSNDINLAGKYYVNNNDNNDSIEVTIENGLKNSKFFK